MSKTKTIDLDFMEVLKINFTNDGERVSTIIIIPKTISRDSKTLKPKIEFDIKELK